MRGEGVEMVDGSVPEEVDKLVEDGTIGANDDDSEHNVERQVRNDIVLRQRRFLEQILHYTQRNVRLVTD